MMLKEKSTRLRILINKHPIKVSARSSPSICGESWIMNKIVLFVL